MQGVSLIDKERFENSAPNVNDSIVTEIDCSTWRTKPWDELRHDDFTESEPSLESDLDLKVDMFFLNNASRRAFLALTGYDPFGTETILTVAKADAWFTTCVLLINTPYGKGGKRNTLFQEMFSILYPRSVESLMHGLRALVESNHSNELIILSTKDFIPSPDYSDKTSYSLQIHSRVATNVVHMPSKKRLYLYIEKNWFEDQVCSWIPIMGANIGTASEKDLFFDKISTYSRS